MHIVLLEPEIPYNTGNVGRTCAAVGAALHLIRPLGFDTSDKAIKRAGMDYWKDVDVRYHDNFQDFVTANGLDQNGEARLFMSTTKAPRPYTEVDYNIDDFIMFGKESGGIPEQILRKYSDTIVRIPMLENKRSLNLSNSVAIVLYEALRQNGFQGLQRTGRLNRTTNGGEVIYEKTACRNTDFQRNH
ncbi:MAG: tRNA (cytidine(34)-2'-O)-methyltransferase [Clostridiales bacterium]|jgi:tRNA (cytidine/uridine-2'-O-)-methyltransferase|nr:tRNA (cytidine(34)-2'-O)-methyltransferase [Clostridiales bacterium]